jgi:hypothetical protein
MTIRLLSSISKGWLHKEGACWLLRSSVLIWVLAVVDLRALRELQNFNDSENVLKSVIKIKEREGN